jgi:SAM-dependent methyltransferase
MLLNRIWEAVPRPGHSSTAAYTRHLARKLREHPRDRDLAFAQAIGADSIELFNAQGDAQVAVLKRHGLEDAMSVYDLGCGCGRTAQALQRAGWRGRYVGADIVEGLVAELKRKCDGFTAIVHRQPSIAAEDASLDMIFHWSVFTHISPEECFLYLEDSFRALKPGGKLVFSFLELTDPNHYQAIFENRLGRLRRKRKLKLLDTFLHRDWIALWAHRIGFDGVRFTEGMDGSEHPPMWQTLVAMTKPRA